MNRKKFLASVAGLLATPLLAKEKKPNLVKLSSGPVPSNPTELPGTMCVHNGGRIIGVWIPSDEKEFLKWLNQQHTKSN